MAEGDVRTIIVGIVEGDFTPTIVACAILAEAYEKAGYRAEFRAFPPNRMVASFDSGEIDAMAIAEARFEEERPDSIRVATPIWNDTLVAFSTHTLPIVSWASLTGYRVGYITAMISIEKNLPRDAIRFPAQDPVQLFKMLAADRTDVVVTSRIIGELMIKKMELADGMQRSKVISSVPNYHFLTKKNADIARRVSVSLETMAKTGRIDAITKETLERIFR